MYNSDQNQTSDNTDRASTTPYVSPFHLSRFHVLTFLTPPAYFAVRTCFLRTFAAPKSQPDFGTKMKMLKTPSFSTSSLQQSFWDDRPIFGNVLGRPTRCDTPRHGSRDHLTLMNTAEQWPTPGAMPPVKMAGKGQMTPASMSSMKSWTSRKGE